MDDGNKIVNALWIGEHLSSVELLTIKSFLNNGHSFVLWAYDEIKTELPKGVILKDANEIFPKSKVFSYKYSNQFGHGKVHLLDLVIFLDINFYIYMAVMDRYGCNLFETLRF